MLQLGADTVVGRLELGARSAGLLFAGGSHRDTVFVTTVWLRLPFELSLIAGRVLVDFDPRSGQHRRLSEEEQYSRVQEAKKLAN